jgi:hypothetical protein
MRDEKLARARNGVAKAEALVRRQARIVEHLASDRDDELDVIARSLLATLSDLAQTMGRFLGQIDRGRFQRGR